MREPEVVPDRGVVVGFELLNPLVPRELSPEREDVEGVVVPRFEKPDLELVPCRLKPFVPRLVVPLLVVPRDDDRDVEPTPRLVLDRLEIPDRLVVRPREVELRDPMLPREREEIPLLRPLERLLRPMDELLPEDPRELVPLEEERLPPEREPPTEREPPPPERPETPEEEPPLWAELSATMMSGVVAAMTAARTNPLKARFVNIVDSPGLGFIRINASNLNYKRKVRTNARHEFPPRTYMRSFSPQTSGVSL